MNDELSLTRRTWILSALAATGTMAGTDLLAQDVVAPMVAGGEPKKGTTILFQGDSITDVHRNRSQTGANHAGAFGRGYPFLIASALLAQYPKSQLKCFNRGISGNKVPDLDERWQSDALDLKPDILSILIGVNDIWHKLNGGYDGSVQDYEKGFQALIARTKKALPETKIVICEPFVLRCGAVTSKWFPEFDERRAAAKKVAKQSASVWVPFQKTFDEGIKYAEPSFWAGDGVHPSMAGHALMARAWTNAVKL